MKTVLAIVVWTLSLFGIQVGTETRIDHIRSNHTEVLASRVVAQPIGARFECLRSASGQCYYTVYPRECGSPGRATGTDCARPLDRFTLARGDTRQLATLSDLRVCVSADGRTTRADCD